MEVFNVIPKKVVDSYDDMMNRPSFYVIADFPNLELQDCKIEILIAFTLDTLYKMKNAWKENIGKTISVKLERSNKTAFILYPKND